MSAPDPRLRPRRSLLFVPGSRPARFSKALEAGADAVCLDLEDGVAPGARERARGEVSRFLAERSVDAGASGPELVVRINDPRTDEGAHDLEALGSGPAPDAVMVPKAEDEATLESVLHALGRGGRRPPPALLPLVETPVGLQRVEAIAGVPGVAALLFGGMDLAAELGAHFSWEPLLYARSRIVLAAVLAGVGCLDAPYPVLDDDDGLEDEARRVARLGFTGKMAIHPRQVPVLNQAFIPPADELERARRIVEAAETAAEGVFVLDGRMVDRPVVEAARRTLARAARP